MWQATSLDVAVRNDRGPRVSPVCRKPTYSRDGIHPQYAERALDRARMKALRDHGRAIREGHKRANSGPLKPFHRRCPNCSAHLHPRRAQCACGYQLNLEPAVPKVPSANSYPGSCVPPVDTNSLRCGSSADRSEADCLQRALRLLNRLSSLNQCSKARESSSGLLNAACRTNEIQPGFHDLVSLPVASDTTSRLAPSNNRPLAAAS
jgi:hypothetical protein